MQAPRLLFDEVQKYRFHRDARGHVITEEVLRDVSLVFEQGSLTALLGPPGAGKTALFRLACRLEEPNGGTILLDGRDIRTLPLRALRQRVGYVHEELVLFGESVEDNVCFGLLQQGLSREEARAAAREILEFVGLDHAFLDRRNGSLSRAQAVRVVLARTLVLRPEVLLVDDVCRHGPPDLRREVARLCRRLARERGTAVAVAAREAETAQEADRVVVLVRGAVVTEERAARLDPAVLRGVLGEGGDLAEEARP